MAATEKSRSSSVLCPLCCLKTFSPRNSPKPSVAVPNHQKRKCMCSPTTHPGSFRCAFHRCLENEKNRTLNSQTQLSKCVNTTSNSGLNLRKRVLVNWLARITSVEAERLRKSLAASMVKPPPLHIGRRFDFRHNLTASMHYVKIKILYLGSVDFDLFLAYEETIFG
ncbi:serine-rich protein-related [Raphanus sativus]|nr:serine-rich protein-related [Raphanus sativus]